MTAVPEAPRTTWAIAAFGAVGVLVIGAAVMVRLTPSGQLFAMPLDAACAESCVAAIQTV